MNGKPIFDAVELDGEAERYEEAFAAMRATFDRARAVEPKLKTVEQYLVDAVLYVTATYGKMSERVSVDELVERTGRFDVGTVLQALERLAGAGVLSWQPAGDGFVVVAIRGEDA